MQSGFSIEVSEEGYLKLALISDIVLIFGSQFLFSLGRILVNNLVEPTYYIKILVCIM